jgi:RHS repeat-associated protein
MRERHLDLPRPAGVYKLAFTLTRGEGVVWRSYYGVYTEQMRSAGSSRIAMRADSDSGTEVYYILTDHLGSTGKVVQVEDGMVTVTAQQWYSPWGESRQMTGEMPTDRTYTGQREHTTIGMLWYSSRFYDPHLGRFTQPDSLVPNAFYSLALDRYQYAYSNPIKYTDPSGHSVCDEDGYCYEGSKLVKRPTVELTEAGRIKRELYERYLAADGWWKSSTGSFTLEAFLGMWILFESRSSSVETWLNQANEIATAIAQNLFVGGWNRSTGLSINAVLNFMGSWVDGGSALRKGPDNESVKKEYLNNPGPSTESGKTPYELIHSLGKHATDINSVAKWDRKNGPSIWGNINGAGQIAKNIQDARTPYGPIEKSAYYINSSFVILSVKQYKHWLSLNVDMSLTNEP